MLNNSVSQITNANWPAFLERILLNLNGAIGGLPVEDTIWVVGTCHGQLDVCLYGMSVVRIFADVV